MRSRCAGLILAVPALLAHSHLVPAQQQAPVTRAEVVQLDVIVTDADGKPARGLAREDFAVFEDGKEQRLTNFVVVEGRRRADAAPAPSTSAPAAPAPAGTQAAAASPGRQLVIVIDDIHIADGNIELVKGALRRMVAEFLGPDDYAALVTTSSPAGSQQLSQDAAQIKQSVTQLTFRQAPAPPAAGSEMTPAQAELILRGDRSARRLAGRKLIDQPGSVFDVTSPRAATQAGEAAIAGAGGGAASASAEQVEAIAEREAERQARAVLNDALRFSAASLHAIEDVLRSLAPLPGRKLVLLVSDGFLIGTGTSEERTRDLRAIVDAATRSGAVVYAVDSRGLQASVNDAAAAGSASPAGLQTSVDRSAAQLFRITLETISADTGGFLVTGTNAFDAGLQRVLAENDSYYLMAYEPTNKKRDGRYRRIDVKLPRHARHVVRTRRGYLAADDSKSAGPAVRQAAATPEPRGIEEAEARTIIEAARRSTGLPLRLAADFVNTEAGGPVAIVHAHADVAALAEADTAIAVDFLGGVYDASGQALGPAFGRRTPVAADALARARAEGVSFRQRLALPPGRYEVRLAARDLSRTRLGGASQWVEIPDLKAGALTLSGLFLSTATPKASGPGATADELRDVQATRRFRSRDSLFFQVYVYNLREEGGTDAVLQAQLRQGETLVAASQPQPIKAERKDGVLLPLTNGMPLESLPRGRYELRVVVMDKKANATVSRQVDFTIE
jgi:VWFA-related protein